MRDEMGHNARWFDASYKVFQRDFKSLFASEFTICWLLKSCKVLENGAYLERECVSFWIREAFESNCKRNWQEHLLQPDMKHYELNYFFGHFDITYDLSLKIKQTKTYCYAKGWCDLLETKKWQGEKLHKYQVGISMGVMY